MTKEQYVENLLLNEILTGEKEPGSLLLPERELAIKYGCSRPVVHKAIIRLENKGVLKIRPRKGVQVLDFKLSGKLSLMEKIGHVKREGLGISFNHDMLEFIKENFKNVILKFKTIEKEPTDISLKEPEDFFLLMVDYCKQCGNHVYVMLMNEFKVGILNVAKRGMANEKAIQLFYEIETLILKREIDQAVALLDMLFDLVKETWLKGVECST